MNNNLPFALAGDDSLAKIEHSLASILKPVTPNPDFVRKLGSRIVNPPVVTLERRTEMKALAFVAFSLFAGTLLVWLLIVISRFFSGGRKNRPAD